MDIPRWSCYGAGFHNDHVHPKPTDRKVGVFSWQHLQLEVFAVQKENQTHPFWKETEVWGCAPWTAVRIAAPDYYQAVISVGADDMKDCGGH